MDKVAVIILNWNGEEMLKRFLPSVVRYSSDSGVVVYVADNGSTDSSISIVQDLFPSVSILDLKQNWGFAEGYNRAIEKVDAEYIVLLNSDVEVSSNWISPIINYLDIHPEVGACQPKIRSWRDRKLFEYAGACGGFIDKYGYPFCRGRIQNSLEEDLGQYDDVSKVFWASGAALFIRKSIYQKVGGLDNRFFAHMEEIDLCWRLQNNGYGLVVVPESIIYHVGGATLSKENPRKTFLNFRNNLIMLYKNLPDSELKSVMRVRFFLDYIAALFFLLKGELGNAKAVFKARKEYNQLKREFSADRKAYRKQASLNLNGVYSKSIIYDYYLRGIKTFSKLKLKN